VLASAKNCKASDTTGSEPGRFERTGSFEAGRDGARFIDSANVVARCHDRQTRFGACQPPEDTFRTRLVHFLQHRHLAATASPVAAATVHLRRRPWRLFEAAFRGCRSPDISAHTRRIHADTIGAVQNPLSDYPRGNCTRILHVMQHIRSSVCESRLWRAPGGFCGCATTPRDLCAYIEPRALRWKVADGASSHRAACVDSLRRSCRAGLASPLFVCKIPRPCGIWMMGG
jgi:hypothetical protein